MEEQKMENLNSISRRDVLKGLGALGVTGLSLWAGGCEACRKQIENRPTRRNIAGLAANDPIIQAYKDAVTAMKALPAADPRNWTKQAEIHFNHCPHQNWWFLPWHRVYLLYFERICRKLSGYKDFALPYWNWTSSPSIPAVFWGAGNPLFDSNRVATQASTADSSIVGSGPITNILNETNFFVFASGSATTQRQRTTYGMLEGSPHNYIHGFVGGDMSTFMSPLDPVFWCHHNILDCLWVDWNINRGNPNTNDANWGNLQFTEFVDEDGNPVNVQAGITPLYPLLSYQFEACGPAVVTSKFTDRQALEKFLREGAPARLDFTRRFEFQQPVTAEAGKPASGAIKIDPEAFRGVLDSAGKEKAVLTVGDAEIPEKQDFFVRLFLNKPDASAATSIDDPHYAGSFAFFNDESAMKEHEGMATGGRPRAGYLVDVTPTLRRLNQGGSLGSGQVDIGFVPVPFEQRPMTPQRLTLGRLELGIAQF